MRITLHEVSKGRGGQALPTTSLEFHTGAVRFAIAETEQRPTVLGLIASGRMRPETGRVTIDGVPKTKEIRRRVALVDAPDVSDPHADITLAGVVGEELMFAGVGATPLHARRWLTQLGFHELASVPIGNIDPAARVRILCELAVLREGVDGVVLVSPDRHGGSPDGWWRIAGEFADRGYAMLVIVGGSAAVALERMQELGAINASGPIEPLVLPDEPEADDAGADTDDDSLRPSTDSGTDADEFAPATVEDTPDPSDAAPDPGVAAPDPSDAAPDPWVAEPVEAPDTEAPDTDPAETDTTENGATR
ncbi:hypothetical protein [Microbacterium sp.]|uniref:hypothetical protein n=1 Tax=Microbacterium sp. TaxID=51671 RepID=UPI002FDF8CD0